MDCLKQVVHNLPIDINNPEVMRNKLTITKVGDTNYAIVTDPELLKRILENTNKNYVRSELSNQTLYPVFGKAILTTDGDDWKNQRRMLMPSFTKERLDVIYSRMSEIINEFVEQLVSTIQQNEVVRFDKALQAITLRIANSTLFSEDISDEQATHMSNLERYLRRRIERDMALSSMKTDAGDESSAEKTTVDIKFEEAEKELNEFIYGMINERRASNVQKDDVLQILIDTYNDPDDPDNDKAIRDQISTLYFAGHDTCATTLGWAFYLMSMAPEIVTQLQQELDATLAGRLPEKSDINNLKWPLMIFKESLRLFPPANAIRTAIGEDSFEEFDIPANTEMLIMPWVIHRNPNHWPDPFTFDPTRFADTPLMQQRDYQFMPFGGGAHVCMGQAFALGEGPLFIAAVMQRFNIEFVEKRPIEALATVALRQRYGLWLKFTERNS